jgi:hypothetical protein
MDYTKEFLIQKALNRLDTLDEVLDDCQKSITNIYAEKQTISYLLWLGIKKEEKDDNLEVG